MTNLNQAFSQLAEEKAETDRQYPRSPVNFDGIPPELRERDQWVLWKYESRDGKQTKVPYCADCQTWAKPDDRSTWSSYQEIIATFMAERERRNLGGIGYVFDADDPFYGIDIDACRNAATGELTPWGQEVVRCIDSYCEISPSGCGVKLIARGCMLPNSRHVWKPDRDIIRFGNKDPEIAIYDAKRYWCITGHHLDGTPGTTRERQGELDSLCARLFKRHAENETSGNGRPGGDDAEPNFAAAWLAVNKIDVPATETDGSARLLNVVRQCKRHGLTPEQSLQLVRQYETIKPFPKSWTDEEVYRRYQDAKVQQGQAAKEAQTQQKKSQATRLVELAEANCTLFKSVAGDAFAELRVDNHVETWRLRSRGFKNWLVRLFYQQSGSTPGSQAVQDSLCVIQGKALFEGDTRDVFCRVGYTDSAIYLDLGRTDWQVIEVDEAGWRLVDKSPVAFVHARGMLPLPTPTHGGTVDELRPFVNVGDDDWPLLISWLVGSIQRGGQFPVLQLYGEQGSAKSTCSRVLRALVDPNSAAVRSSPREERDLIIAASNSWIVALDNLSFLPSWLSDAVCRLSTGGGFASRQLYTDDEEQLFEAKRPVIINGIEDLGTRGDLLDRSIVLTLPRIPQSRRRPETEFWQAFGEFRPSILGGILDAVSVAIANRPGTHLPSSPRMSDFAHWLAAAEPALPWDPGTFLRLYQSNRDDANQLALDASPVAAAVMALADEGPWSGTPSALMAELTDGQTEDEKRRRDRDKSWPKTAKTLSGILRRLAPNLREAGYEAEFWREPGGSRKRMLSIRKGT